MKKIENKLGKINAKKKDGGWFCLFFSGLYRREAMDACRNGVITACCVGGRVRKMLETKFFHVRNIGKRARPVVCHCSVDIYGGTHKDSATRKMVLCAQHRKRRAILVCSVGKSADYSAGSKTWIHGKWFRVLSIGKSTQFCGVPLENQQRRR